MRVSASAHLNDAAARNRRADAIARHDPVSVEEAARSENAQLALTEAELALHNAAQAAPVAADAEMYRNAAVRLNLVRIGGAMPVEVMDRQELKMTAEHWCEKASNTAAGDDLTALTIVVEAAGLPALVPEDVNVQGRPRDTAILPAGVASSQPYYAFVSVTDRSREANLSLPAGTVPDDELPLLAAAGDTASPAPMIRLVDAAGVSALKPGRGARIDKRILIYALLSMPLSARMPDITWRHEKPLSWWIDRLYPSRWRPVEQGPRLIAGLRALVWASIRLPEGGDWLPVVPRRLPNVNDRNSPIRLDIELPPGSDRGALLSWPRLIEAGTRSDPAFDAVIGLAYLWDQAKARNGGHRIYATRPKARRDHDGCLLTSDGRRITSAPGAPQTRAGQLIWPTGNTPTTDWRHPQAVLTGQERHPQADRVSTLTRDARRRLVFPSTTRSNHPSTIRSDRLRADQVLTDLQDRGSVVIEHLPGGVWRLLEPRTAPRGALQGSTPRP